MSLELALLIICHRATIDLTKPVIGAPAPCSKPSKNVAQWPRWPLVTIMHILQIGALEAVFENIKLRNRRPRGDLSVPYQN